MAKVTYLHNPVFHINDYWCNVVVGYCYIGIVYIEGCHVELHTHGQISNSDLVKSLLHVIDNVRRESVYMHLLLPLDSSI